MGSATARALMWMPPRSTGSRRFRFNAAAAIPRPDTSRCFHHLIAPIRRLDATIPKCIVEIGEKTYVVTDDISDGDDSSILSNCAIPVVRVETDLLESESLFVLQENTVDNLLTALPVLSDLEQCVLASTPAHPNGLYALYASFLAGSFVEQLWNLAWPAAVTLVHSSLLPVAIVSFFSKLAIFVGGPLIGNVADSFPRIPAYNSLCFVQTASQLLSVMMIIYALKAVPNASASMVLLQPWFHILVVAASIERLAGSALGVMLERDWVVRLAGTKRTIALAEANAVLSRVELFSEMAGASLLALILSKYSPVKSMEFAASIIICSLPLLILLGYLTNKLSCGVLDCSKSSHEFQQCTRSIRICDLKNAVEHGLHVIKHGWMEYAHQPVLPASVAYVMLCFNIALTPGALMTAFLTHHGAAPSTICGFSALCALMGISATFIAAGLVKQFGILKVGAAGLIQHAALLTAALSVILYGYLSKKTPLFSFLSLIVASRLGHMTYSVIETQILQTGIPANKANLIGTTEVSVASFAEFMMLGIAIVINDASHFGFLAILSLLSVFGASWIFCHWLGATTEEQRRLFSHDSQF